MKQFNNQDELGENNNSQRNHTVVQSTNKLHMCQSAGSAGLSSSKHIRWSQTAYCCAALVTQGCFLESHRLI